MTEQRAREAAAPSSGGGAGGRTAVHPDQAEAMGRIADRLGTALGREVRVRPRGTGYKVELAFAAPEDALALARRIRHG